MTYHEYTKYHIWYALFFALLGIVFYCVETVECVHFIKYIYYFNLLFSPFKVLLLILYLFYTFISFQCIVYTAFMVNIVLHVFNHCNTFCLFIPLHILYTLYVLNIQYYSLYILLSLCFLYTFNYDIVCIGNNVLFILCSVILVCVLCFIACVPCFVFLFLIIVAMQASNDVLLGVGHSHRYQIIWDTELSNSDNPGWEVGVLTLLKNLDIQSFSV